MRLPASFKWIGLALIGLVIAAVVALAATGLISRQIGIDSESITAGDTLAPAFSTTHRPGSGLEDGGTTVGRGNGSPARPTEGSPTESFEPTEPVEVGGSSESGGDGGGEGPDD